MALDQGTTAAPPGSPDTPQETIRNESSSPAERLPVEFFRYFIQSLDFQDVLTARRVSRKWRDALQVVRPLKFPAVYRLPIEVLQHIFTFAMPGDFNNARRVCRAWYVSSLDVSLQQGHLKSIGFSTDPLVRGSKNPLYLARRLARECSLGADGSGRSGLRNVAILDLSDVASTDFANLTVSVCGSYALLCEGCVVHVYRLWPYIKSSVESVARIVCPRRVLAVSMDTSRKRYSVAILLDGRMGLVHDIVGQEKKYAYKNLCSGEDAPRSVAICPQRKCVAFGCQGGIELHWVDGLTGQDLSRWFPLTAPTDFLYFLPPRRGIDSAKKLRLISSAAYPGEMNPLIKRFGITRGSIAYWGAVREPAFSQSDHHQAVPLSDGHHILFTDPGTGRLCLGCDAPLGGPTKLLRKIWLIPPDYLNVAGWGPEDGDFNPWIKPGVVQLSEIRPNIYTSGADIRYGVRVVAGYDNRIVFFSIPPDSFDNIAGSSQDKDGRASQGTNAPRNSSPACKKSVTVRGCYIDTAPGLIDLAVHSGPEITVYAFSSSGITKVYRLDDSTASSVLPVTKLSGEDGEVWAKPTDGGAGKSDEDEFFGPAGEFAGWDGNLSEIEEERRAWESAVSQVESIGTMDCEVVL